MVGCWCTMMLMTIVDLYKHITETIPNYLTFLVLMALIYLFFCLTLSYVTECVCKIIIAIRAPITASRPPEKPDDE